MKKREVVKQMMRPYEMYEEIFKLCKEYGYEKIETTVISILEMVKEVLLAEEKSLL